MLRSRCPSTTPLLHNCIARACNATPFSLLLPRIALPPRWSHRQAPDGLCSGDPPRISPRFFMPTIPFHLVVRLHTAGLNNLASEEPILVIIAPLPPKRIALIARLKFKFPVSATRNGFIIGVFLLMCPPCLHRQSSPPRAQVDHRHLLVRVLRHRCASRVRGWWSLAASRFSAPEKASNFALYSKRWKNALFRKKKRHHVTPQIRN